MNKLGVVSRKPVNKPKRNGDLSSMSNSDLLLKKLVDMPKKGDTRPMKITINELPSTINGKRQTVTRRKAGRPRKLNA